MQPSYLKAIPPILLTNQLPGVAIDSQSGIDFSLGNRFLMQSILSEDQSNPFPLIALRIGKDVRVYLGLVGKGWVGFEGRL